MGRYFFILTLLFILNQETLQAQIHEIGVFGGGANYVGDIGPTDYIAPEKAAFGFVYKWNKSRRHAYRFTYTHGKFVSSDYDSDVSARVQRGFSFKNAVNEFSAGLEFNFFEFDLHKSEPQITPYVFTGINFFNYNELYHINAEVFDDGKKWSFSIPIVLGIKGKIAPNWVLAFEVGARYTFTDNLDGSYPTSENLAQYRFGNINSNDWYIFSGFTLTYTFGENPCFCPY